MPEIDPSPSPRLASATGTARSPVARQVPCAAASRLVHQPQQMGPGRRRARTGDASRPLQSAKAGNPREPRRGEGGDLS
jgi:hypothetical protein